MPPTDFDQTQTFSDTRFRLGPPDSGTLAARETPRAQRTPQQRQLLSQREKLERRTLADGGEIKGGILQLLLDEEKAAQTGVREATAGVAHQQAKAATLQANGMGPDGRPLAPGAPPAGQRMASPASGQYQSPASAQYQSPAAQQGQQPAQRSASQGFAMRKMPDGSFKTSSTINQATGQTEQRQFETRDLALAFYGAGPQPAPVAGATSGVHIAQQPGAPAPRATPAPGGASRPGPAAPEVADPTGYGSDEPVEQAQPSMAFRAGAPLGASALMQTPNRTAQPVGAPGATQALTQYLTQSVPQSGPAGAPNLVQDRISDFAQSDAPPSLTPPSLSATAMGAARSPRAAPGATAGVPLTIDPNTGTSQRIGPAQVPAAPALAAAPDAMPSTSRYASPTTKMKQTSKMMGTPRADAGTQDFFGQLDDYGF